MSSDIIVTRLTYLERLAAAAWEREVVQDAKAEIVRLRAWKTEAVTVLMEWHQIADHVIGHLDADDTLGRRLPEIVASELERLRAERNASRLIISDLTAEVDRMRAAGDALAEALEAVCDEHDACWCPDPRTEMAGTCQLCAAEEGWQEVRRG